MFKFASLFASIVLAASLVSAQELALPAPGGPGATAPMPIPPKNTKPVPPPPGSGSSGTLEPFPGSGQPNPNLPVPNDPVVYTLGYAVTSASGSRDYVFYPDAGYNRFEVVSIVGTAGFVRIHSVKLTYRDGRRQELQPRLNGRYRQGQGNVLLLLEPNVSSVVVHASDDGGIRDPRGAFRVDVKATQSIF